MAIGDTETDQEGRTWRHTSLCDPENLQRDYLRLPLVALKEVGRATQTLGAIWKITTDVTFVSVDGVAAQAMLPRRTTIRQLQDLIQQGWVLHHGREAMASGRRRRTVTYELSPKAKFHCEPFAPLPRWAARYLNTWPERVVFALIVGRRNLIDYADAEGKNFDGRERYSLRHLIADSGLSRPSVCKAKEQLVQRRLIHISPSDAGDLIYLNDEFVIRQRVG